MNLDEVVQGTIREMSNRFKEIKISDEGKTNIVGKETAFFTATGESFYPDRKDLDPGCSKAYVFIDGLAYYELYYSGSDESFQKYLPVAERIIESFQSASKEVIDREFGSL